MNGKAMKEPEHRLSKLFTNFPYKQLYLGSAVQTGRSLMNR